MAYGPITSRQIDGEIMETVIDFIFFGLQNHCRWWLQPREHVKKQRCYFADKGPSSQSYGFSSSQLWMWELDHKEHWRTDAFELWSWRRLLRVPWTARRSNKSILKEISPEYSLEGLMLKLLLLSLRRLSRVRLCATPWTAAHQAPPSLGFSRQEHWSGLPFPSPMHASEKWKWSRSVISDS